jgi:hypothetical protein
MSQTAELKKEEQKTASQPTTPQTVKTDAKEVRYKVIVMAKDYKSEQRKAVYKSLVDNKDKYKDGMTIHEIGAYIRKEGITYKVVSTNKFDGDNVLGSIKYHLHYMVKDDKTVVKTNETKLVQ